uniref:Uncharacterized protein n=1 Tax=Arundo donax TaxID=35708 RepID=A0A0A8YSI2_ARUDO
MRKEVVVNTSYKVGEREFVIYAWAGDISDHATWIVEDHG